MALFGFGRRAGTENRVERTELRETLGTSAGTAANALRAPAQTKEALLTPALIEAAANRGIRESELRSAYSAQELVQLTFNLGLTTAVSAANVPVTLTPPSNNETTRSRTNRSDPVINAEPNTVPRNFRGDPLQAKVVDNTALDYKYLGDLSERTFAPQIEAALRAGTPLPRIVQEGPTCGLALAVAVMAAYQKKHPNNASLLNPLVHRGEGERDGARDPSVAIDTNESLLEYAQRMGYTREGAIFDIEHMADIYRHYGYDVDVVRNFNEADLNSALDAGHTPVFSFDVARDGNLSVNGGNMAHWAALEGHFLDDATNLVLGTHTWEGADYLWRSSDVVESSRGMRQADQNLFPEAPDLRATLAGHLVVVKGPLSS